MEAPPIPSVSIKYIVDKKRSLFDNLVSFQDKVLSGQTYDDFLEKILFSVPSGVLKTTLDNNFKYLLGSTLEVTKINNLSFLIAGNLDALLNRHIISISRLDALDWAAAQIVDAKTVKRNNGLMHAFQFRILTGPLAAQVMTQYWSFKKTAYLAVYRNDKNIGFGFNRSKINSKGEQRNKLIFNDIRQFYGLRCFVLFDPSRSQELPYIAEVGHRPSTMEYNQKLLKARDRSVTDCIKGLKHNPECYRCPYGTDKCPIATHPKTYLKGNCPICNRLSFFDPQDVSQCVDCVLRELKQ